MNPKLWRAIDRIGSRKASRFEWEAVSGLPWSELEPFLRTAGGHAEEVPDPEDASERLVIWNSGDKKRLLESQHVPAHRPPIEVDESALILHHLKLAAITASLAEKIRFHARRPSGAAPLHAVGFVQDAGANQIEIVLFVPTSDPRANVEALARFDPRDRLLLIPTARWMTVIAEGAVVRDLETLFSEHDGDYLVNVAAAAKRTSTSERAKGAIVHVSPGDRWEDVTISFVPESGTMRVRIGAREGSVTLYSRGGKVTRAATILGRVLAEDPPHWSNDFFPDKKESFRKAFQLFTKDLQAWIPIGDGKPFREDRSTHCHHARFSCLPLSLPSKNCSVDNE